MSWNKPANGTQAEPSIRRKSKLPIVIIFIVSSAAVLLFLYLNRNSESQVSRIHMEKSKLIQSVNRQLINNGPNDIVKTEITTLTTNVSISTCSTTNITGDVTNKSKTRLVKIKQRRGDTEWLFENHAECELQRLLEIKPGEEVFVESDYKFFEEDFDKAIKKPIVFVVGEDKEKMEKRRAVMEMRNELEKRRKNGEDIRQIMLDSQRELVKAGEYRQLLKDQLIEMRNDPNNSKRDIPDLVAAANEMLRQKGLAEITCPALWKYQAERIFENERK